MDTVGRNELPVHEKALAEVVGACDQDGCSTRCSFVFYEQEAPRQTRDTLNTLHLLAGLAMLGVHLIEMEKVAGEGKTGDPDLDKKEKMDDV